MRIINGNQKDKFKRKHIVKITFRKKGCCEDDVFLSLSLNNLFLEVSNKRFKYMFH